MVLAVIAFNAPPLCGGRAYTQCFVSFCRCSRTLPVFVGCIASGDACIGSYTKFFCPRLSRRTTPSWRGEFVEIMEEKLWKDHAQYQDGVRFMTIPTGVVTCRNVCRTQATGTTTASLILTARPAATTKHGPVAESTRTSRQDMRAVILPPAPR
jgi:hypothetical protein